MKAVEVITGTGVPLKRSDVDTDQIIPAEWLKRVERTGFEKGLFSTWRDDRDFVLNDERYAGASVLVAGASFGVGSSREHAPIAIKAAGISCVVAKSFARIFYRNSFNMGLPIFESGELADAIAEGDEIEIDSATGVITLSGSGRTFNISPIPPFMEKLIADGGLMKHIARK